MHCCRVVKWCSPLETSLTVPQEDKYKITVRWAILTAIPKELKSHPHKNLFTVVQKIRTTRIATDKQIKMFYIHIMEYYSFMTRNEAMCGKASLYLQHLGGGGRRIEFKASPLPCLKKIHSLTHFTSHIVHTHITYHIVIHHIDTYHVSVTHPSHSHTHHISHSHITQSHTHHLDTHNTSQSHTSQSYTHHRVTHNRVTHHRVTHHRITYITESHTPHTLFLLGFCCCDKQQKQPGEERGCLAYGSWSHWITEESLSRN